MTDSYSQQRDHSSSQQQSHQKHQADDSDTMRVHNADGTVCHNRQVQRHHEGDLTRGTMTAAQMSHRFDSDYSPDATLAGFEITAGANGRPLISQENRSSYGSQLTSPRNFESTRNDGMDYDPRLQNARYRDLRLRNQSDSNRMRDDGAPRPTRSNTRMTPKRETRSIPWKLVGIVAAIIIVVVILVRVFAG